ncbi:hypothetical protein FRC03_009193 [Tulasnella sp. 419]|nr:hypothetical protein FRC03_009193 [Tulasnella sp. 419]
MRKKVARRVPVTNVVSRSRPNPFKLLPTEVNMMILHHNRVRRRGNSTEFSSFSLVCPEWRHIAQRILFTEVTIHKLSSAQSFLAALRANPALGDAITILRLFYFSDKCDLYKEEFRLIREITDLSPRLYQLEMRINSWSPRRKLFSALGPQTYSNLKALALNVLGDSLFCKPKQAGVMLRLTDILKFLGQFTTLRHLRFPLSLDVQVSKRPNLHFHPSFHLYELFFGCLVDRNLIELLGDWLLGGTNAWC